MSRVTINITEERSLACTYKVHFSHHSSLQMHDVMKKVHVSTSREFGLRSQDKYIQKVP